MVKRTQAVLAARKEPIAAYAAYLTVGTYWNVLLMYFFGAVMQLLCMRTWGRKLLLRYPGLFSNGCAPTSQQQRTLCQYLLVLSSGGHCSVCESG